MAIQRSRLEGRLESAVLEATSRDSDAADPERAIAWLERLVTLSPMCCQPMLRLISMEMARGRRTEARLQYERYAKRLKLEFDEEPPAEPRDDYEVLKAVPDRKSVPSLNLRRPAYAHRDPWVRTRCDAPVIAVLPFRYDGPAASGPVLATALADDITMILSGCRWFSVLSRSTTHSLAAGAPFVPRDFARLTGADYLMYGFIVERADARTLTIELADAETGHIRWVNRYEAPPPTCAHGRARCVRWSLPHSIPPSPTVSAGH
jgi:TolB-like protein